MRALGRRNAATLMHHFVGGALTGRHAGLEAVGGEIAQWCVAVFAGAWTHRSALVKHEPLLFLALKGCKINRACQNHTKTFCA